MEEDGIEIVEGDDVGHVGLGGLLLVEAIAPVEGVQVALDAQGPVDRGILGGEVGLVEIIFMGDVSCTEAALEDKASVRPDQHCDGASTASRPRRSCRVDCNVRANLKKTFSIIEIVPINSISYSYGQTTIPSGRFDPGHGVEQGSSAAITSIRRVNALDIGVACENIFVKMGLEL